METSHGQTEAAAWAENITTMVQAYNMATALDDDGEAADDIRTEMQESPLEVTFRSGWESPTTFNSSSPMDPQEYKILLSTGGPAVWLQGAFETWGDSLISGKPRLMYQGWWEAPRELVTDAPLEVFVQAIIDVAML